MVIAEQSINVSVRVNAQEENDISTYMDWIGCASFSKND